MHRKLSKQNEAIVNSKGVKKVVHHGKCNDGTEMAGVPNIFMVSLTRVKMIYLAEFIYGIGRNGVGIGV